MNLTFTFLINESSPNAWVTSAVTAANPGVPAATAHGVLSFNFFFILELSYPSQEIFVIIYARLTGIIYFSRLNSKASTTS